MKERPILFSAPMVRALLDGSKTQTRRPVKRMALEWLDDAGFTPEFVASPENTMSRYGQPGDRLWVRETWAEVGKMDPGLIVYRADYPACVPAQYENVPAVDAVAWKPSIHMFRRYSRILLEVVSVRIERLQDISYEDALAEGIVDYSTNMDANKTYDETPEQTSRRLKWPQRQYQNLWNNINGAGSWEANPWVWCVEFKLVTP